MRVFVSGRRASLDDGSCPSSCRRDTTSLPLCGSRAPARNPSAEPANDNQTVLAAEKAAELRLALRSTYRQSDRHSRGRDRSRSYPDRERWRGTVLPG